MSAAGLCWLALGDALGRDGQAFEHPAGWLTRDDLARVRSHVRLGREPWATAYNVLMNDTSLTKAFRWGVRTLSPPLLIRNQ